MRTSSPLTPALALALLFPLSSCDRGADKPAAKDASAKAADAKQAEPKDANSAEPEPPAATCPKADAERVSLMTEDSVELIADHYSPGLVGAPGIVLLHMIPPHHDLDNYPRAFIDQLVGAGFEVINVNRRGAPGSKGIAEQAYQGEKGKLDALAAVRFLQDAPCKPNPAKLAIVGASNGTTSMVDYAVHANTDDSAPLPAAMIFLSGGDYTEAQTKLADHLDTLAPIPSFLAYPAKEATWNEATKTLVENKGPWRFEQFEPGAHGTKLFKTESDLAKMLTLWLEDAV